MSVDRSIDLRGTDEAAALPELLALLDQLPAGDRLQLTTTAWPGALLSAVEQLRPHDFICGPLGDEPGNHRVEFGRRPPPEHAVTGFIGWDQRRLDDMLDDLDELASGDRFEQALGRYRDFRCGLRRHMELEEKVLFPLFARLTGDVELVRTMHAEHVLICAFADEVGDSLAARDLHRFVEAFEQLQEVLDAHDLREEREIYPRLDRAIPLPEDREALVDLLQTV
jgi:regulator of cell morphogenesis and NO signaling